MINVNFNTYASYVTDSLYQWDINQVLSVSGLNLSVVPEVHFSNAVTDKAIVRQATMVNHIVSVGIPNSLLQEPLRIYAHIGIYEGDTFKVVEVVEIPVIPRKRPNDYSITDADEEIYSFKRLENLIANMVTVSAFNAADAAVTARIDNIIAHNNDTDGNTELIDIRTDINGDIHGSAGQAVRKQTARLTEQINLSNNGYETIKGSFVQGGLNIDGTLTTQLYYASSDTPITYDHDVVIRVKSGYSYKCYQYNNDGTYSDTAVKTTETIIPAGRKFLLRIQTEPVTYDNADINLFTQQIYCESYIGGIANITLDNTDAISDLQNGVEGVRGFYDRGSLSAGNHAMWINYRVCTPNIITYDRDIEIYAKDGFIFAVHTFDDLGVFESDSSWLWKKVIKAGTQFKIVIKRVEEDTSEYADIREFKTGVYIESVFKRDILDNIYNPFKKNYICHGKTPLIGHRGLLKENETLLPENSILSFEAAAFNNMWAIEADIRETSDGKFVCMHDDTIDRTTNGTGNVEDMTLATLKTYYLTDSDGNATEYTIPTLEEYLLVCKLYGVVPLIEIKAISTYDAFFKIIRNYGMIDNTILTGGLWRLDTIRQYSEDILYIVLPTQTDYAEVYDTIKHYRAVGVSLLYTNETLTEAIIHQMHESNIFVCVWAINDVDLIKSWFSKGADAIVTDNVTTLI